FTVGDYLAGLGFDPVDATHPNFEKTRQEVLDRVNRLLSLKGSKTVDDIHKKLGHIMWEYCGMARNEQGLIKAKGLIRELREEFWRDVTVLGENDEMSQSIEKAGRVADFLELGELMVDDALNRRESCGGHFREESQTEEGEAK